MKKILFNATNAEELRVAIVDGKRLHDLDIETGNKSQKKANIYKGIVTRVEASLDAAFVDYGEQRHGFLPLKEVIPAYRKLREGQEIIVQVEKEERGNKGAALSTYISLAGRYLVLMPNNPKAGGVSRKIEAEDRSDLRETLKELKIPENAGAIARTVGVGRSAEELQWDLDYLVELWESIEKVAEQRPAPFMVFQEHNVIIRALRDYLRDDIAEVIIDDEKVFDEALDFVRQLMPHNENKIKLYQSDENTPLFTHFQIEKQIETAHDRTIQLKSGGSIVIDHTEALTSIDINSARATQGSDIEETALNTNLEAADEIARQLRIRDLGGLVVIDFIDMINTRNQREVENRLQDAVAPDRARVQLSRISRFGLLEMSRQRLRPSLSETSHMPCTRCDGKGTIRTIESSALHILRLINEKALKDNVDRVVTQAPIDVSTFLLNEKRTAIADIETRTGAEIIIVPDSNMQTPAFKLQDIRGRGNSDSASYTKTSKQAADTSRYLDASNASQKPALSRTNSPKRQPIRKKKTQGFLGSAFSFFSSSSDSQPEEKSPQPAKTQQKKAPAKKQQAPKSSNTQTSQKKQTQATKKKTTSNQNPNKQQASSQRTNNDAKEKSQDNRKNQSNNPKPKSPQTPKNSQAKNPAQAPTGKQKQGQPTANAAIQNKKTNEKVDTSVTPVKHKQQTESVKAENPVAPSPELKAETKPERPVVQELSTPETVEKTPTNQSLAPIEANVIEEKPVSNEPVLAQVATIAPTSVETKQEEPKAEVVTEAAVEPNIDNNTGEPDESSSVESTTSEAPALTPVVEKVSPALNMVETSSEAVAKLQAQREKNAQLEAAAEVQKAEQEPEPESKLSTLEKAFNSQSDLFKPPQPSPTFAQVETAKPAQPEAGNKEVK